MLTDTAIERLAFLLYQREFPNVTHAAFMKLRDFKRKLLIKDAEAFIDRLRAAGISVSNSP